MNSGYTEHILETAYSNSPFADSLEVLHKINKRNNMNTLEFF
jgi:hypothetical protein